jgi:hypothetical protein
MRKCRFGFPKPFSGTTHLDSQARCVYKRGVQDAMLNNYNPYLLAVWRTSMDIQYNDGPQAVRYLAKYLAKDSYETKVALRSIHSKKSGHYQKSNWIPENEHYATRIMGAIEATYDIMSWTKFKNSREAIFVNTKLASDDVSRRLKEDIKELPEDSIDIYSRIHIGKRRIG